VGKAAVGEESVAIAGRWVEESDTARPEGSWHEHDEGVHVGCERFFRPSYNGNLVAAWLPALDGVTEKLRVGATVADVGCGLGASTRLMAEAFPRSTFTGGWRLRLLDSPFLGSFLPFGLLGCLGEFGDQVKDSAPADVRGNTSHWPGSWRRLP
jgi:hypothetical protein